MFKAKYMLVGSFSAGAVPYCECHVLQCFIREQNMEKAGVLLFSPHYLSPQYIFVKQAVYYPVMKHPRYLITL